MIGPGSNDDLFDVSDSTDWLGTPLASLTPLDASLRCQVCKDFYKTPMITSCSHTFCSLCIRRCLVNDGKCPACRATEQENKLRSNWAVEGLVEDFLKARPALLSTARKQSTGCHSPKRKISEAGLDKEVPEQARKKTRSSSRISTRPKEIKNVVILDEDAEEAKNSEYEEEDGFAACPVCNIRMKVESIDPHLNSCLNEPPPEQVSILSKPVSMLGSRPTGPHFQRAPHKPDRLPHLNYSLFKDVALRKKLQDLGISAQGSRQLLERRHAEWVTIWNANCDASRPRRKVDLLHDLEVWEKTQGARAHSSNGVLNSGSQILHKDFDGAGWAAKHNQSFQDLIISARKKLGNKEHDRQPERRSEETKSEEQISSDKSSIRLLANSIESDIRELPENMGQESIFDRRQDLKTSGEPADHQIHTVGNSP